LAQTAVAVAEVELPIRYDASNALQVGYLVPTAALQARTPSGLRVVELAPGFSALGLSCFEYGETNLGPYNEVGVSWPVVPERSLRFTPPLLPLLLGNRWPGMGWWVRHLPVDTAIAHDTGRAIWGYPKFLARIELSWEGARRVCRLSADGKEIFRLSAPAWLPALRSRFRQRTYSIREGELLSTEIDFEAEGFAVPLASAKLELGDHPVGRELASMGLQGSRPLQVRWYPVWKASLPKPEPV
jgi:hypothetical protein